MHTMVTVMNKKTMKDNSDVTEHKGNVIVQELLNINLKKLEGDFIIFPSQLADSEDLDKDNYIFKLRNQEVWTGNIVGFLNKGDDCINITTRFFENDLEQEDYFLKYLLEQVLGYNVINTSTTLDNDNEYLDLLVYLFPMYLNQAMEKGIYKEYIKKQYNDFNIKGPINISRHIKMNTPFMGKVAYDTREFSFDNKLTQLIRHTIEKIKLEYNYDFNNSIDVKENINQIVQSTNSYSRLERLDILEENIFNPIKHGYYNEYYKLQQLCIKILNEEKVGIGNNEDKINGILIDVAWLWEEYLNTLLKSDFIHPQNKVKTNGIPLFVNDERSNVYPDFYSKALSIVLDAKYKRLDNDSLSREDKYQIITYMHILDLNNGGIIFPSENATQIKNLGDLSGIGGVMFKVTLQIPQVSSQYIDFKNEINKNEEIFKKNIQQFSVDEG